MTNAELDKQTREISKQYGELVKERKYKEASNLFKKQSDEMQNRLLWLAFDGAYNENEYSKRYL